MHRGEGVSQTHCQAQECADCCNALCLKNCCDVTTKSCIACLSKHIPPSTLSQYSHWLPDRRPSTSGSRTCEQKSCCSFWPCCCRLRLLPVTSWTALRPDFRSTGNGRNLLSASTSTCTSRQDKAWCAAGSLTACALSEQTQHGGLPGSPALGPEAQRIWLV